MATYKINLISQKAGNKLIPVYASSNKDKIVNYAEVGTTTTSTKIQNGRYYVPRWDGWIQGSYCELIRSESSIKDQSQFDVGTVPILPEDAILNIETSNYGATADDFLVHNISSIFGMPYQFMSSVDRRLPGSNFGRKYADKILARSGILFLSPGRQKFLHKSEFTRALIGGGDVNTIKKSAQYYTIESAYSEYYSYVNKMCAATANMIGIGRKRININGHTASCNNFNWAKLGDRSMRSYFSDSENIAFYIDGLNSISESFSSSTRASQLAQTINGLSDTAQEVKFLLGHAAADAVDQASYDQTLSNIQSVIDKFSSGEGVLSGMVSNISAVLKGGKLIFPEMWSDSEFNRSYSCSIKLVSPDADDLSIWLNIIVPYVHLLALVLPQDFNDNTNGYTSPFLVKAYYKSLFNIEMGLITDVSVTRGGECCFNANGLPTQMTVDISIVDLYKNMHMSDLPAKLAANTQLMDYLCNLTGVNLVGKDPLRIAKYYAAIKGNQLSNVVSGTGLKLSNKITKLLDSLYKWQ